MDSAALAQALWADIGAQRWDALAAYFPASAPAIRLTNAMTTMMPP